MRPIESSSPKGRVKALNKARGKNVRAGKDHSSDFQRLLDEADGRGPEQESSWEQAEDKVELGSQENAAIRAKKKIVDDAASAPQKPATGIDLKA